MRNNKEQMKQMYKAQGMEMSDEQIDNMSKMMEDPNYIKMVTGMMDSNPDFLKQAMNMP
jgi:hypothetical protein